MLAASREEIVYEAVLCCTQHKARVEVLTRWLAKSQNEYGWISELLANAIAAQAGLSFAVAQFLSPYIMGVLLSSRDGKRPVQRAFVKYGDISAITTIVAGAEAHSIGRPDVERCKVQLENYRSQLLATAEADREEHARIRPTPVKMYAYNDG